VAANRVTWRGEAIDHRELPKQEDEKEEEREEEEESYVTLKMMYRTRDLKNNSRPTRGEVPH
jgi:hypothetical protein